MVVIRLSLRLGDPWHHSPVTTLSARATYSACVHVDVMTTPLPLRQTGDHARRAQQAGFSGLLFTEAGRGPACSSANPFQTIVSGVTFTQS